MPSLEAMVFGMLGSRELIVSPGPESRGTGWRFRGSDHETVNPATFTICSALSVKPVYIPHYAPYSVEGTRVGSRKELPTIPHLLMRHPKAECVSYCRSPVLLV